MKKNIYVFTLVSFLLFISCGTSEQKSGETVNTDSTATVSPKELTDITGVTSYYECPMKCDDKKFAEAGICPVCGMELVLVNVKSDSTIVDTAKTM